MAWIKLNVDAINEANSKEPEHIELEGLLYQDASGNLKKFRLKALMPTTTSYMQHNFPDYDWDITANHVILIKGEEIKEV